MRNFIVGALLVMVAVCTVGQEARVVQLSDEDARSAKLSWERLQKAKSDWEVTSAFVKAKYLQVPVTDAEAGSRVILNSLNGGGGPTTMCADQIVGFAGTMPSVVELAKCHHQQVAEAAKHPAMTYRRGFENGFEFSSDFKYVVPTAKVAPRPLPSQFWNVPVPAYGGTQGGGTYGNN